VYNNELTDEEILDIAELDYHIFYKNNGQEIERVKLEMAGLKNEICEL